MTQREQDERKLLDEVAIMNRCSLNPQKLPEWFIQCLRPFWHQACVQTRMGLWKPCPECEGTGKVQADPNPHVPIRTRPDDRVECPDCTRGFVPADREE